MKLQLKETYKVNGIEYSSLEEARRAMNNLVENNSNDDPIRISNFKQIPVYNLDVSELVFYPKVFKNLSLLDVIELRQQMSNEKHRFVLPTYSEIISMIKINRLPNIENGDYWTSTRFLYNTYITYKHGKNQYGDIYPQDKAHCFFLIKENKEDTWFFDPPIKNSIAEMIYLQEKERGKIVHSY
jgi:hypothetical protein